MPSRASTSLLQADVDTLANEAVNECQCPHGLVPHCYKILTYYETAKGETVSMPSRASTSLLRRVR